MTKTHLSWLAVALALAGVSVLTGHPAWGLFTAGAILLAACAVAIGAVRTPAEVRIDDAKIGSQKLPHSLVTLSAAAIIAVYAAGFQRTRSAEEEFEARAARRKAAAIAAVVPVPAPAPAPPAAQPDVAPPPVVYVGAKNPPPNSAPPVHKKTSKPQPASGESPEAEPSASASVSASAPQPSPAPAPDSSAGDDSANAAAVPATPPAPQVALKDGTYYGWGSCRHGDIQAEVVIKHGRIDSTGVASCQTRYSCSVINAMRRDMVSKQSTTVDFISGATESSEAFTDAVNAAIAHARE